MGKGTAFEAASLQTAPAVLLVRPYLSLNVGAVARAMLNFGLTDLRVVQPQQADWLNEDAIAMSVGASEILTSARQFDSVEEAVADLHVVYGTTARPRDRNMVHLTAREATKAMVSHESDGRRVGLMFGCERSGLSNEEMSMVDVAVKINTFEEFSSLNLAQAVLLISHEYFQAKEKSDVIVSPSCSAHMDIAPKKKLGELMDHLHRSLSFANYFRTSKNPENLIQKLKRLKSPDAHVILSNQIAT